MTTIGELVDRAARRFGSRIAVVDGERTLTFAEVGERSTRLGHALRHLTPVPSARVGILVGNRAEFVEVDFAVAKAGMVKAPLNPRLSDEERAFILQNCGASVLVTERSERARIEGIRSELPDLRHVVYLDEDGYELLLRDARPTPGAAVDPAGPSMILHTSGTTGHPKGATTSQVARLASMTNMLVDEFLPTPSDGMVHAAPMSHGSGSKILSFFVRGARNIAVRKFDPPTFFAAARQGGGTSSFLVPTMIRMLLDAGPTEAERRLFRNLTYGGAPTPVALAREAMEAFGPVLTQVYGSCEAPHPVTVLGHRDHEEGSPAVLQSAGHEALGVQVRIVDERGQDVDGPGELLVRGANLMTGYWNDPVATGAAFLDGWYRTGDVARRNEAGFLSIVGRKRDMVISGGLNVYPAEVEEVLQGHPAVSEVAVFGVPDDVWGEAVAAAIVVRAGHACDEPEIRNYALAHLADYKKPRHVRFVGSLPKGMTGKVLKDQLAQMFLQGA